MVFIVIYDANVLYPNTLRDLLIRIAQLPHLVQAKWTDQILDEMLRNLRKNLPDISEQQASRLRERMNAAVRDCLVVGYEPLVEVLDLPDPDDRHVLAAAIKVNAQLIVTWNRRDFPQERPLAGAARCGLDRIHRGGDVPLHFDQCSGTTSSRIVTALMCGIAVKPRDSDIIQICTSGLFR